MTEHSATDISSLSPAAQALLRSRTQVAGGRELLDGPIRLPRTAAEVWAAQSLNPLDSRYNIPVAWRLRGRVDAARVTRALTLAVGRHPVLRSTVTWSDGSLWVEPRPAGPELTELGLLKQGSAGKRSMSPADWARHEAAHPFDLSCDPPYRFRLLELGDDDHALLLTFHHALVDGWSVRIFLEDFVDAYRVGTARADVDHSQAVADLHAAANHAVDCESAGRRRGDPLGAVIPFADAAPPKQPTFEAGRVHFALDTEVTEHLGRFCASRGVSPVGVTMACFGAVLSRLSGSSEAALAVPMSRRPDARSRRVVGPLLEMVDIHVPATLGDLPSLASDVWRQLVGLLDGEPPRDRPASVDAPLASFQMLPARESLPGSAHFGSITSLGEVAVEPLGFFATKTRHPLELHLTDHADRVDGVLSYSTERFELATAERLVWQFEHLLTTCLGDSNRALRSVSLLPAPLSDAGAVDGTSDPPLDVSLTASICRSAANDRPAIIGENETTDYEWLLRASHHLSLAPATASAGTRAVAVCAERGPSVVVGMLAAHFAGAPFLLLDPNDPPERIANLLLESEAAVLLTDDPTMAEQATRTGVPAGDLSAEIGRAQAPLPQLPAFADAHPAYLVFTSGSTGRPKPVSVPYSSLRNLLSDPHGCWASTAEDRCMSLATPGFDVFIQEVLSPLSRGASLHFAPEAARRSPRLLFRWMEQRGITAGYLPPRFVPLFAEFLESEGRSSLRQLMVGVEPLAATTLRRIQAALPDLVLTNGYGPAEACVCSTVHVVTGEPDKRGRAPIGRPISNVTAHVLEPSGLIAPPGMPGEVYIGGAGVANGYLSRPRETAEHFVPDHLGVAPGARLYRTGDIARYRPDGQIEFVGRFDDQVKIDGVRVEIGEVVRHLVDIEGVDDGVVTLDTTKTRPRLVAWAESTLDPEQLRDGLMATLPRSMMPSEIVTLPELPRTANGKVATDRLTELNRPRRVRPAFDDYDYRVGLLYEAVLGERVTDAHASFFALGGDSLQLVELRERAISEFGLDEDDLPLEVLFAADTVARVAEMIRTGSKPPPTQPISLVEPSCRNNLHPTVLVPGLAGGLSEYQALTSNLAAQRRVVGLLQHGSPEAGFAAPYTDEATKLIDAALPAQRLLVIGWSFGAARALDVAAGLEASGRSLTLVVIDAASPSVMVRRALTPPSDFDLISDLVNSRLEQVGRTPDRTEDATTSTLAALLDLAKTHRALPNWVDVTWARSYGDRVRGNLKWLRHWSPPKFNGRAVVFQASSNSATQRNKLVDSALSSGLSEWTAGEVVHYSLPGSHHTILSEPSATGIARLLMKE